MTRSGESLHKAPREEKEKHLIMRRFSFNIDLRKGGQERARPEADGYQMSSTLAEQRQALRLWPSFQRTLEALPTVEQTMQEWDDPHLGAEYVRIYQVSREKVLEAEPGFTQEEKTETHCFFSPDGTKHLVSRLLARPNARLNEIRALPNGLIIRLYYENTAGTEQPLDNLFEQGLAGIEEDIGHFARWPNYVLRFFILTPSESYLESVFRGVCFYDAESGEIVTEEATKL